MAKRMKLISEAEYNSLISKSFDVNKSKIESISPKELLEAPIPADIKLALYMKISRELIDQFSNKNNLAHVKPIISEISTLKTVDQFNNPPKIEPGETKKEEESEEKKEQYQLIHTALVQQFPAREQEVATEIISTLESRTDLISWNENGEVTFFTTEKTNCDIFNLIVYLIREGRWPITPTGANRFILVCKAANIPETVVRKSLRSKYRGALEDLAKIDSLSDSFTTFNEIKSKLVNWEPIDNSDSSEDMFDDPLHSTPKKT